MSKTAITQTVENVLNALELCGLVLVLLMAFTFQFILHELPCPLCLLQRIGFLAIGFGLLLNLRFGLRPSHYALTLISALFTAFVALRQIALHVAPGTGSYGEAIFGLHMYTWSFIISILFILATSIMLGFDRQYWPTTQAKPCWKYITYILFALLFILALSNAVSAWAECGLGQCPDNPTHYLF